MEAASSSQVLVRSLTGNLHSICQYTKLAMIATSQATNSQFIIVASRQQRPARPDRDGPRCQMPSLRMAPNATLWLLNPHGRTKNGAVVRCRVCWPKCGGPFSNMLQHLHLICAIQFAPRVPVFHFSRARFARPPPTALLQIEAIIGRIGASAI